MNRVADEPHLRGRSNRPQVALAFALREMRGGLAGFYIFLACIALGVGAITGVNAVAASIANGIAERGQTILGGDLSLSIVQRDLPEDVVGFIGERGDLSKSVSLRAMARLPDGSDQSLVELKAVDNAYPLYGELRGGDAVLDPNTLGPSRAWVDPLLLERLGLTVGSSVAIGNSEYEIAGTITDEPDRLSDGFAFGPRVMLGIEGLERSGLIRPGSLFRTSWMVRLDEPGEDGLRSMLDALSDRFPAAQFRVRSRENAAPSLARNIERFSQFLTLVGLASLIVGGVGVANSVRAYLDMKRDVIATLKSLGASGRFIFGMYLMQIMMLAGGGVILGVLFGLSAPYFARFALAGMIPLPEQTGFGFLLFPAALGAAYGLLTAFIFAVWPLGKAREIKAATLFRSSGFGASGLPGPGYIAMLVAGLGVLCWLAIAFSGNQRIALIFLAAMMFAFLMLRLVAIGIQWLMARLPAVTMPGLRLAIANIHRPGSATPSVVLSLGLGLALIAALTMIDGSLRYQITANIPERAPAFFFVDIQSGEFDEFREKVGLVAPDGEFDAVPMLRGRVTRLKGIAAEDYKTDRGQWVLRGDRGITYAMDKPDNATISKGEWWPRDYDGEPLVSFAAEEAEELGLDVGDLIEVNVLGRQIEARIANLRHVEWETLSINFVMVFSPNAFAGAPHGWLATLAIPRDVEESFELEQRDGRILRAITEAYPTVTTVRVRDAIDTVNELIGQLSTAIRAASTVALVAAFLVLAGALAASNRTRAHDAVILKTLGARRAFLIRSMIAEYALLGVVTALFGLVAGSMAGWFVVTRIMEFTAIFQPREMAGVVLLSLAATVILGLVGTWRVLGRKPGPALREP